MDDDIDLRQYLRVIWARRGTVAAAMLVMVLAALGLVSVLPPVYEAKAMVLVQKPTVQVGGPAESPGPKISAVLMSELPTSTLLAYAQSPAVTDKVSARVVGSPDRPLPVVLKAQVLPGTNLVEFRVRGRDPEIATEIANVWAKVVASESAALFSTEARGTYGYFAGQADEARRRLAVAEQALSRFNSLSTVNVLTARREAITADIAALGTNLTTLEIGLHKTQAELAQAEAQLKAEPRSITLSKSLTSEPDLRDAASQATNNNLEALSRLKLKTEEINPVFLHLSEVRVDLRVKEASLRAERARTLQMRQRLQAELARVEAELASQQLEQTQLTRAVEVTGQLFGVFLQRQEEARAATRRQGESIKLVAAAMVPRSPVAPNRQTYLTLAAFLGLIAGALLALMREYLVGSVTARTEARVPAPTESATAGMR